ncbi:MAG: hypothetical protein J5819_09975 [Eubacterium sp.]|nr:hypothetical protein [Eubacterium sp.]
MDEYLLMNKDRKLVLFVMKLGQLTGRHTCEEIERYVDDSLLPPRFGSIGVWLDRRNYAKHKEHLVKWLKEWQIEDVKGFADMTHGLGLNDSLWVKPADSDLTWDKVNLYDNEFMDVVSKTSFEKGLHGLKLSTTSPEFTSEGSFEKCWIQESDGIFLYKKGSSGFANAGKEMYSEFYASQYAQAICDDSVPYDLVDFKGNIVSRCRMFTTADEGFVPIYKYLEDKSYDYDELLDVFDSYGFADDFRHMLVLDSVILNEDRHYGNFGFIVDNDTFEIKRFAPVFDHNMSMLARAMPDDLTEDSEYIREKGHKLGGDFVTVGRWMLDGVTRDRLKDLVDVPMRRHETFNLPQERTDFLNNLVQKHIRELLA